MNEGVQEVNKTQQISQPQPAPSRFNKKRIATAVIILLILLAIVFGLYGLTRKQTPTDILLATVGNEKIYKSTVEKVAVEQYVPSAIDSTVLKRFLDIVVERAILDNEAKKLNITVSQAEINTYLTANHISEKNNQSINLAKYILLKQKIIAKQVVSIKANTIGYWISPNSHKQIPLFGQQRTEGKIALQEAEQMIRNGIAPIVAARQIYDKYIIMQSILTLNGYFLSENVNADLLATPKIYNPGDTDFDESIFLLKPNEIEILDGKDGAGAILIQVVSVNNGSFQNYESWLNSQKKILVKNYNSL